MFKVWKINNFYEAFNFIREKNKKFFKIFWIENLLDDEVFNFFYNYYVLWGILSSLISEYSSKQQKIDFLYIDFTEIIEKISIKSGLEVS